MQPAREAFAAVLSRPMFAAPKFVIFTNTTGRPMQEPEEVKKALVQQVVSPVLWEDCMRAAASAGATEFWELGPGGVLSGLARRTEKSWAVKSLAEFADVAAA
jgi:[acyl-carrier-protein] S-malonyltransferase